MNEDKAREAFEACPFCGLVHTLKLTSAQELAQEGEDEPEPWEHSDSYAVVCDASRPNGPGGCGAQGGFKPTPAEAVIAWNRRAALQWAASQQAAEGHLQRDADRWRQLARMEASMAAPETLAHYIARPDRLDFIAKLRAEPVAAPPSTQGGADEQR